MFYIIAYTPALPIEILAYVLNLRAPELFVATHLSLSFDPILHP